MTGFSVGAAVTRAAAAVMFYFLFRFFWELFPFSPKGSWKSRILSAVCAVFCGWFIWPFYGVGAMWVLHFAAACLFTLLLHLILRRTKFGRGKLWKVLAHCYLPGLALMAGVLGYGYWNMHRVVRTEYQIDAEKDVPETGIRIAAFSDLHLGLNMDAEKLAEYCAEIEAEQPDMLLLAGDIFDESTERAEMERAAEILGGVETAYGTFFVFGNHDPNLYSPSPAYTAEELRETLEKNGVTVLEDEIRELGDSILLIGRKDASTGGNREAIEDLVSGLDPEKLWILMDHQPRGLAENAEAGIDIQISGHTHAGQMWPAGPVLEWAGINEMNYGLRYMGDTAVIVSSGIAGWGYPMKTGGPCEYLIIEVS